jgi:hypothetical protein
MTEWLLMPEGASLLLAGFWLGRICRAPKTAAPAALPPPCGCRHLRSLHRSGRGLCQNPYCSCDMYDPPVAPAPAQAAAVKGYDPEYTAWLQEKADEA